MVSLRASTMDSVETSASTTCVSAFLPSLQAETVRNVSLFVINLASSLFSFIIQPTLSLQFTLTLPIVKHRHSDYKTKHRLTADSPLGLLEN